MQLTLPSDSRLPRYHQVADTIRQAVSRREWKPGQQLPSEVELAERFGVAPGTVRQAITRLVDEGMLERQQGRGTFVRRPDFSSSFFRFFRFQGQDGEQLTPESKILKRSIETPEQSVRDALDLVEDEAVVAIQRLRLVEDQPVLYEEICLPHLRFAAFLTLRLSEIGPLLYPIYEEFCGQIVARAQEQLTACSADALVAKNLGIEKGAPVVAIKRIAMGYDGRALEWRRSWGAAETFQYHVDIF
ncbi:GntR family transcriptional regulator [Pelagibius sp. Alg239-R121]|uniref:GntR family transcriptional regulator n=1 Tax=Pelagibius sp. Alg239-R121 TaxID=2993448 RepID=UPI0024A62382|nr:GntR family transcriptional regulator [Pelagibius sp. Alg239-R121]